MSITGSGARSTNSSNITLLLYNITVSVVTVLDVPASIVS